MPCARAHSPALRPASLAARRHRPASVSSSIFRAPATGNLRVAPESARRDRGNHPGVADGSRRCRCGRTCRRWRGAIARDAVDARTDLLRGVAVLVELRAPRSDDDARLVAPDRADGVLALDVGGGSVIGRLIFA